MASSTDDTATIVAKLAAGRHVVLSPGTILEFRRISSSSHLWVGIYRLSEPLVLVSDGQVLLGLGYATLIPPSNGEPCVRVLPNLEGVRIAGILLQVSLVFDKFTRVFRLVLLIPRLCLSGETPELWLFESDVYV